MQYKRANVCVATINTKVSAALLQIYGLCGSFYIHYIISAASSLRGSESVSAYIPSCDILLWKVRVDWRQMRVSLWACESDQKKKKQQSYLDALNAGFAVVAFDVYINFGVANKAERQKGKIAPLLWRFVVVYLHHNAVSGYRDMITFL